MRRKWGFSLMELLIVVFIVGILAAMALPGYGRMVERTVVRDARATLNLIYQAERMYRLDQTVPSYGTLNNLINSRYLPNPEPNTSWDYAVLGVGAATFTGQATRTGGQFNGNTVTLDQNFDGKNYGGTHPLR